MENTVPEPQVSTPIFLPLLNSIPPHLAPKFESTYVEYYNKYSAGRLATHQIPIETYRANPAAYTITYGRALYPSTGLKISTQTLSVSSPPGTITIQIFDPETTHAAKKPVYVNFHGGGWVFGGLPTDFDFCKQVAKECGAVVFDVDYRLAPEERFPTQVEDCWEALKWIHSEKAPEFNLDLNKVAIGGCSAGGHLVAVLAHLCRDHSLPLKLQLLSVPVCDLSIFNPDGSLKSNQPYPSYSEFGPSPPLPLERMSYFFKHFLGDIQKTSKYAMGGEEEWKISPIKARNWKGLADALVVTAECDVLRDEGEAYARKLEEGGNRVRVVRVKGAPHIFMQLDGILEAGREYNRVVLEALSGAF
ncbi:esterase, partial [Mollisia scopiformis]